MCGQPASKHLRADGQQAGDEAVWVEEGSDEGEGEAEGDWTLDNPPMLQLQVFLCNTLLLAPQSIEVTSVIKYCVAGGGREEGV